MHGLESQPEKQLGISPVCNPVGGECNQPSGPASSPSVLLSLFTCPTSLLDVTGLRPSGQGRSQQTRADVAAVLWGWLEVRCLWLMHPL